VVDLTYHDDRLIRCARIKRTLDRAIVLAVGVEPLAPKKLELPDIDRLKGVASPTSSKKKMSSQGNAS